jgi:hypothetical protein
MSIISWLTSKDYDDSCATQHSQLSTLPLFWSTEWSVSLGDYDSILLQAGTSVKLQTRPENDFVVTKYHWALSLTQCMNAWFIKGRKSWISILQWDSQGYCRLSKDTCSHVEQYTHIAKFKHTLGITAHQGCMLRQSYKLLNNNNKPWKRISWLKFTISNFVWHYVNTVTCESKCGLWPFSTLSFKFTLPK